MKTATNLLAACVLRGTEYNQAAIHDHLCVSYRVLIRFVVL